MIKWNRVRKRAKHLKQQVYVLWYACKDPRTAWYTKGFAALIVAYAFSPIDLIPDFIPFIGHLDDLIIVPLGISLAMKMIPKQVIVESHAKAEARANGPRVKNWFAGAGILAVWALIVLWVVEIFI